MQCSLETATLEDRDREGGSDNELSRRPVGEVRELKTLQTCAAIQRYARIKIGFCHADRRRGRMQLRFRSPYIGSALHQLRRKADGHLSRQLGHIMRLAERLGMRARLLGEQYANRVDRGLASRFERRNQTFD